MNRREWEWLAERDPMWAICSDPRKANGGWSPREFFATGEEEIGIVFNYLHSLGISPNLKAPALDFGCGVGRLTRALGKRFETVYGVDGSTNMVRTAKEWNNGNQGINFAYLPTDNLRGFEDDQFGFIYSSMVLQHIKPAIANQYIGELMRVASPGAVLVFQLADGYKISGNYVLDQAMQNLRVGLRIRTRMLDLWNEIGPDLAEKMPVIKAYGLRENQVRQTITANSGQVRDVRFTNSMEPDDNGSLRFLDHEPARGWISKQYCVVKR